MSVWGRVFAAGYDRVMAGPERAGLSAHRAALLSPLRGVVLEIGGGTGANLDFYGSGLEQLVITEPEAPMRRRLEAKLSGLALPVSVIAAAAEELPFRNASFDTVVSTLVLCTVGDLERSLSEVCRVLKPGGSLIFLEHVRAQDPRLAAWQDRLHGLHRWTAHGCHCNRRTLAAIEAAGLQIRQLERDRIRRTVPIVSPLIAGRAVAPSEQHAARASSL